MVAAPFVTLDEIDTSRTVMTREEIQEILPQRHEFAQLDAICHLDPEEGLIAGYKDLEEEPWWAVGHIPGRPLMPGVILIEAAAQTGAILLHRLFPQVAGKFIGFGGVDRARFRGMVEPPARVLYMARRGRFRPRLSTMPAQAWVEGKLVFEGTILGAVMDGIGG